MSAPDIEAAVLRAVGADPERHDPRGVAAHLAGIERITLCPGAIELQPSGADPEKTPEPIIVPWSPTPTRRKRELVLVPPSALARPIRAETRARLVQGIANARLWIDDLSTGRVRDTAEIAAQHGCSERSVRMTLNLAFLSPEIMKAAVEGTLSRQHGVSSLADAPQGWREQAM